MSPFWQNAQRPSREVEIAAYSRFACPVEQADQCRALQGARFSANQDDDAGMRHAGSEPDEVVPVAGDEEISPRGVRYLARYQYVDLAAVVLIVGQTLIHLGPGEAGKPRRCQF